VFAALRPLLELVGCEATKIVGEAAKAGVNVMPAAMAAAGVIWRFSGLAFELRNGGISEYLRSGLKIALRL
jgi:hypothetical protein